jgi:predicted P-loop ATPase
MASDAADWDDENPGLTMPKLLEDNGSPCRNAGNVARMLAIYPRGVPRYNTLSYRVEWPDGSEVTDGDESRVQDWLLAQEHAYRVRASLETVHQGILDAAEARPFQPVRDYLESLVWDGVPRAQAFGATYLGAAPGAYTESVTRCMLNGAVARALDPGCQHDTVIVLEGRQGARKTSAIRALFGGKYFSNTRINFHKSPDCYQANDGVWCRELAEFDGYTRGADVAVVKDYVSSREDRYRPSYARNLVTRRRQCVFIGTTNAAQYLHDETGSRRYLGLPVGVAGAIDTEAILRDRDQIWAEVVAWYRAGIPWWLDATMEAAAADQAEERYSGDTWEERLPGLLEDRPTCTAAEALELLGVELSRQGRAEQMRVGAALRRIGWVRRRTMTLSVRTYEYVRAVKCPT